MSRLNFLYKELPIDNYQTIKQEFTNYYYNIALKKGIITQFYNPIDSLDCSSTAPYFMDWANSQQLSIRGMTFIRARPFFEERIHIDSITEHYDPYDNLITIALNIPITDNCPFSHTVWYKRTGGDPKNSSIYNPVGSNIPFVNSKDDTEFEEICRINLKTSTLLNIRIYHNVINPTDTERVAISIRFKKDPWWLVE